MKCHEAKRHLDLFMDGELSVPENLKVLEHLNLCAACGAAYEGEKALRSVLRARVGSDAAPADLADRLSTSLAESSTGERGTVQVMPRRRLVSVAAAAAFFVVALLLVFASPIENPRAFAAELSTKHKETREGFCGQNRDDCLCLCGHCCAEAVDPVGKFFQRTAGRGGCSHDLSRLGYRPIGASVWPHMGRLICWTVLRDDQGRRITHGLVSTKIALESKPLFLACDEGCDRRPVLMEPAHEPGLTCVFIFDTEDEAERFSASRTSK